MKQSMDTGGDGGLSSLELKLSRWLKCFLGGNAPAVDDVRSEFPKSLDVFGFSGLADWCGGSSFQEGGFQLQRNHAPQLPW